MNYRRHVEMYRGSVNDRILRFEQTSIRHSSRQQKGNCGIIQFVVGWFIVTESLLLPSNLWIEWQGEKDVY